MYQNGKVHTGRGDAAITPLNPITHFREDNPQDPPNPLTP